MSGPNSRWSLSVANKLGYFFLVIAWALFFSQGRARPAEGNADLLARGLFCCILIPLCRVPPWSLLHQLVDLAVVAQIQPENLLLLAAWLGKERQGWRLPVWLLCQSGVSIVVGIKKRRAGAGGLSMAWSVVPVTEAPGQIISLPSDR